jgi:hypothetical protein
MACNVKNEIPIGSGGPSQSNPRVAAAKPAY